MTQKTAPTLVEGTPDRAARRHELDVERRRAHPGEPRRTVVSDRAPPRDDRRGAHGYAR
jgi:hypothetical protein